MSARTHVHVYLYAFMHLSSVHVSMYACRPYPYLRMALPVRGVCSVMSTSAGRFFWRREALKTALGLLLVLLWTFGLGN